MKTLSIILLSVCALVLAACQTGKTVQFVVPGEKQPQLIEALREVAESFGMSDKLPESKVLSGFAYYLVGDLNSYFMVGARKHNTEYVVDISAYEAGRYDKEKFKALETAILGKLEKLYGGSLKTLRDHKELIPLVRSDT